MNKTYDTSASSLFDRIQELGGELNDEILKNAIFPEDALKLGSNSVIKHITQSPEKETIIQEMFKYFPGQQQITSPLSHFSGKILEDMLLTDINALLLADREGNTSRGFLSTFSEVFFQPAVFDLIKNLGEEKFSEKWSPYNSSLMAVAYYTERPDFVESSAKVLSKYSTEDVEYVSDFIKKVVKSALQVDYASLQIGILPDSIPSKTESTKIDREGMERTVQRTINFFGRVDQKIAEQTEGLLTNLNPMAVYNVVKALTLYVDDDILPKVIDGIQEASNKKVLKSHKVIKVCHSYLENI